MFCQIDLNCTQRITRNTSPSCSPRPQSRPGAEGEGGFSESAMSAVTTQPLRVYQDLADWYERQSQPQLRDRFLLLAADAALSSGMPDEAERLRQRLLQVTPHHMLKPFASFAQALRSPDVQGYVSDMREKYPLAQAV